MPQNPCPISVNQNTPNAAGNAIPVPRKICSLPFSLPSNNTSNLPISRATQGLIRRRPIGFLLVEQVGPGAAEVDNLGATVAVLFEARALEAVKGVRDALAAADDALVLVVSKRALVADADEGRGADVGVADGALAVTLVAEAADGDAGLLAAHYEIAGGRC